MKKENILLSSVIVLAAVFAIVFLLGRHVEAPTNKADLSDASQNPDYTFICPDGKDITAVFHLPDDASVDIALSDGRTMNLAHAMSADGARYANSDESFVFWNKGTNAIIQEGGVTTYDNCTVVQ